MMIKYYVLMVLASCITPAMASMSVGEKQKTIQKAIGEDPAGALSLLQKADRADSGLVEVLISECECAHKHNRGLDIYRQLIEVTLKKNQGEFGVNCSTLYSSYLHTVLDKPLGKHVAFAKLLLKHGADPNIADSDTGWRAIHYVTMRRSVEECDKLIPLLSDYGADFNAVDKQGNTAIHLIINKIGIEKCRKLIPLLAEYGADLNRHNIKGFTPILTYISHARASIEPERIELLLQCGADPNITATDEKGYSIAHIIAKGPIEKARQLIPLLSKYDADFNIEGAGGNTPLMLILALEVFNGYSSTTIERMRLLLDHGANPNAECKVFFDGSSRIVTPLGQMLSLFWTQDEPDNQYRLEGGNLLLEYGACPCIKNKKGETLLEVLKQRNKGCSQDSTEMQIINLLEKKATEGCPVKRKKESQKNLLSECKLVKNQNIPKHILPIIAGCFIATCPCSVGASLLSPTKLQKKKLSEDDRALFITSGYIRKACQEEQVAHVPDVIVDVIKKFYMDPLLYRGNDNILEGHELNLTYLAYDAASKRLFSASMDKTIKVWDTEKDKLVNTLEGHKGNVNSLFYDASSKRLFSASWDHTIKVWDPKEEKPLYELKGHKDFVEHICYDSSRHTLFSASDDKTIKAWNTKNGKQLLDIPTGHTQSISALVYDPCTHTLFSASHDETIKVWDAHCGKELHTLKGHTHRIIHMVYDRATRTLFSASWDKKVRIWRFSAFSSDEKKLFRDHLLQE